MNDLPRFQRLDGTVTDQHDPLRGAWYGPCGYWTDDWSKLKLVGPGIPCCPVCSAPGCQIDLSAWQQGATKYEAAGHFGYRAFVAWLKERCCGRSFDMLRAYQDSDFTRSPRRGRS